jgi:hypothetical protein
MKIAGTLLMLTTLGMGHKIEKCLLKQAFYTKKVDTNVSRKVKYVAKIPDFEFSRKICCEKF